MIDNKMKIYNIAFVVLVIGLGATYFTLSSNSPTTGQIVVENIEDQIGPTGDIKEVTIDMYNWDFTQSGDEINPGDTVRLKITSSEGRHGIMIPELNVRTGAIAPGEEEIIEFVADKAGSFSYFCTVPCGSGHGWMQGELQVV